MEGEHFYIDLTDNAKLKTLRTVPFAYQAKFKAELETLQMQSITTPVTHPTE